MKLWRLTRAPFLALDGEGARQFGGRYSSPGRPVVSLASEAGLAVLVSMRYATATSEAWEADYLLGWTEVAAMPKRVPEGLDEPAIAAQVDQWLENGRGLLLAIPSKVLPEADVVLMNPHHPGAATVPPLTVRAFRFPECLHRPPMLDRFG